MTNESVVHAKFTDSLQNVMGQKLDDLDRERIRPAVKVKRTSALPQEKRPNILVAISDDQAWPHASAYGCRFVDTPAFDRVAKEGVLFTNAFCPAPQCSPSRAGLLTGLNLWQLEEGAVLWSLLPAKYDVYPDLLEACGYHVGMTYKGWGPGNVEHSGRTRNPAGPAWDTHQLAPPVRHINTNDYSANFEAFLNATRAGQPFCFWYGSKEPHREYEKGCGLRSGKRLDDVDVPGYLPDCDEVRSDLLDYAYQIEWFDMHLGRMITLLEKRNELDNTIIVVTGDNGLPFPRAKANLYCHGMHVPLAISWPARVPSGRTVTDLVSFIDLAPTFLQAAGVPEPQHMTGQSLLSVLTSSANGRVEAGRDRVLTGKERHAYCRSDNRGYPCRAIHTDDFLYIRNYEPHRWPAGEPDDYMDIDSSPTKEYMMTHRDEESVEELFKLAFEKRPEEELFAMKNGYACLKNLADDMAYAEIKRSLRKHLETTFLCQGDPRMVGLGSIFDTYPYYGPMGEGSAWPVFPGFHGKGKYNPDLLGGSSGNLSADTSADI